MGFCRRAASPIWLLLIAVGCVNLQTPAELRLETDGAPTIRRDAGAPDGSMTSTTHDAPAVGDAVADGGSGGDTSPSADRQGPDPDLAPVLIENGAACGEGRLCRSGFCVAGLCCNEACTEPCRVCNLSGREGSCSPVPDGQDPKELCPTELATGCKRDGSCDGRGSCRFYAADSECGPPGCQGSMEIPASRCDGMGTCVAGTPRACPGGATCAGAVCPMACTTDPECGATGYCSTGACQPKRARGAACTAAAQCSSGFCVDGFCCNSACGETCRSCAVASSLGSCVPVPDGTDPRDVCAPDPATSCRLDGFCDGQGACRLHRTGTVCGSPVCSNAEETPAPTCNGAGTCQNAAARGCGGYLCSGTACGTSCSSASQCNVGFTCTGNLCVALPGPVLYWKLDESSGTAALDASGNGLSGTYTGGAGPVTSTMVPPVMFSDPASRRFTRSSQHAIRLAPIPNSMRNGDLTVSVWYLASSLDPVGPGAELVSGGDNFIVRLRPAGLEVIATRDPPAGESIYVVCSSSTSNHLDGQWHHAVGVFTGNEVRAYLDGVRVCARAVTGPLVFRRGTDLFAGRHGFGDPDFDFEGNLDDVRVYARALSPEEITRLAQGR